MKKNVLCIMMYKETISYTLDLSHLYGKGWPFSLALSLSMSSSRASSVMCAGTLQLQKRLRLQKEDANE